MGWRPFPNRGVAAVAYVAWSSVLTVPLLFPLSGFMVLEYGVAAEREDAGYLAGFLASCFMLGRTMTAAVWGLAADKYGVVPVMALCTVVSSVLTAAVGLVDSYTAAVCLRVITGAANPIIALVKGVLPDLVTPEEQHRAMSAITAQWQFGIMTGPALSGFLAYPCGKSGAEPNRAPAFNLLCKRPFLLATATCGAVQLSGLLPLLSIVRPRVRDGSRPQPKLGDPAESKLGPKVLGRRVAKYRPIDAEATESAEPESVEQADLAQADCLAKEPAMGSRSDGPTTVTVEVGEDRAEEQGTVAASAASSTAPGTTSLLGSEILGSPSCRLVLGLYCFGSLLTITSQEACSLLVMTPMQSGGLGDEPADIGSVYSAAAALSLLFQLTIGPRIVSHLGLIRACKVGLRGSGTFSMFMPFVPQLAPTTWGFTNGCRLSLLAAVLVGRLCCDYILFSSVFVLVNDSVPKHCRGRVNGFAMSLASICKAAGPSVGTAIYAMSLRGGLPAPLDGHLIFLLLGTTAWLASHAVGRLPSWAALPFEQQPRPAGGCAAELAGAGTAT